MIAGVDVRSNQVWGFHNVAGNYLSALINKVSKTFWFVHTRRNEREVALLSLEKSLYPIETQVGIAFAFTWCEQSI